MHRQVVESLAGEVLRLLIEGLNNPFSSFADFTIA
jgi:hypothetical protein